MYRKTYSIRDKEEPINIKAHLPAVFPTRVATEPSCNGATALPTERDGNHYIILTLSLLRQHCGSRVREDRDRTSDHHSRRPWANPQTGKFGKQQQLSNRAQGYKNRGEIVRS